MYRKGVSALIINHRDEFLLVNLNSFEEKYFAIPGGGVEEGESLEEATYREVREELGIDAKSLELVGKSDFPLLFTFKTPKINKSGEEYLGSERHFFGFRFIGDDTEIVLQEDEVRSYRWVSFAELDKYLLFDSQLADTVERLVGIFPQVSEK